MNRRRWVTQKLQINSTRRGTSRFDDAYDAREAARIATKRAREGWNVEVVRYSGPSAERRQVKMTCEPIVTKGKTVAKCTIKPAFKKQIRGL